MRPAVNNPPASSCFLNRHKTQLRKEKSAVGFRGNSLLLGWRPKRRLILWPWAVAWNFGSELVMKEDKSEDEAAQKDGKYLASW